MKSLSVTAIRCLFLLWSALAGWAQAPRLLSQDSLVIMGDTLAPLALLSGGDRIYTPARNNFSDNSLKLVRATADGFRVWESNLQFQGYLGNYRNVIQGTDGTAYFHYQRDNGYYMMRIDRAGLSGTETILASGLADSWSFWSPAAGFGDTLAIGGPRSYPAGTSTVNVFTRAGLPVSQVTLKTPPTFGRSVAVVEGGNLLLVEWESTDVVRKLYLEKIDPSGASLWRKPFDGGPDGDITSILTLSDGYLVAGYAKATGPENHDAWLFKIGFDGEIRWSKTWGDRWDDKINVIMACRNGGYLLGGQATIFSDKKELHAALWRVNGSGDTSWSLLLPPYPITAIAEPAPGTFHLLGVSAAQKKWFAILGPENPLSVRSPARSEKKAHAIFLPAGDLPATGADGYNPVYWRADGKRIGVLRAGDGVTGPLPFYPGRVPGAAFFIANDPGTPPPAQGGKP